MDSLLLAKNNLEEAVKMMPGNPVFRYHLGLALYRGKDFVGARNEFQKAIKMGLDTDKAAEARDLLRKSQEKEG